MLLKSGKPVVLCVNKCDSIGAPDPEFYEFYNLGIGDPIAVSSTHGHGTGDLLDEVVKFFPENADDEEEDDDDDFSDISDEFKFDSLFDDEDDGKDDE